MGDLIDRQAAIDALMEILDRPNHAEFLYTDEICGVLGSLPSAERKKGRWVDVTDGIYVWKVCDQCGEKPLWNEWKTDRDLSSFCPKCGVEMENSDE